MSKSVSRLCTVLLLYGWELTNSPSDTHPFIHEDSNYQMWFNWEEQASHSIDFTYAFLTEKCPSEDSDIALFEADVWHPGMPDPNNDFKEMREWLNQVERDGVPAKAYVNPTHGQVRQLKELIQHNDYVYAPKTIKDWKNGQALC